jgi:putative SOS response-associated peptidase YedK
MIPPYSKTRRPTLPNGRPLSTNNARRERMVSAPTFRDAWKAGRRCLIPALSYDEPYWGTGKNIWWRFWRADEKPWMLAGLWSEWTDHETGEVIPNYTMITQNCDGHPLLKLMHKPDPKLPADQQDKRAVVPIEREHWEAWLLGTPQQAESLIQVPPLEVFRHGAADPTYSKSRWRGCICSISHCQHPSPGDSKITSVRRDSFPPPRHPLPRTSLKRSWVVAGTHPAQHPTPVGASIQRLSSAPSRSF